MGPGHFYCCTLPNELVISYILFHLASFLAEVESCENVAARLKIFLLWIVTDIEILSRRKILYIVLIYVFSWQFCGSWWRKFFYPNQPILHQKKASLLRDWSGPLPLGQTCCLVLVQRLKENPSWGLMTLLKSLDLSALLTCQVKLQSVLAQLLQILKLVVVNAKCFHNEYLPFLYLWSKTFYHV